MDFIYKKIDLDLMRFVVAQKDLEDIFNHLMYLRGDVDETLQIMDEMGDDGYFDEDFNLDIFKEKLLEGGIIGQKNKQNFLTDRGGFMLRQHAFEEIFSKMKKNGTGHHFLKKVGNNRFCGDLSVEKRRFEFGDDWSSVDMTSGFFNGIRREGKLDGFLQEQDFDVFEKEASTDAAIVLMIDISHSMILYGEDRITPAKKLALVLAHIITTQYPQDSLSIVLFGDDAIEVKLEELHTIGVGPFHTNTQMGLRKSREILLKKKQSNKQIIMITDGKPSAIKLSDDSYYKNAFGLDPEIVSRTLDEGILCRCKNIPITTFMITQDEILKKFVQQLTKCSAGKAFFCNLDNLGEFVVENFLQNKKNLLR